MSSASTCNNILNEIVKKSTLREDKVMPKKHLHQPGFSCETGFYSLKRSITQKLFIKIGWTY